MAEYGYAVQGSDTTMLTVVLQSVNKKNYHVDLHLQQNKEIATVKELIK